MATTRPLRDVFTELTGDESARASDPAQLLAANGHADLPDGLVAEAVVTFADTAPIEVAQHLTAYVAAHSPVPLAGAEAPVEAASWLDAMATAPAAPVDGADPTDGLDELYAGPVTGGPDPGDGELVPELDSLDFGHGPSRPEADLAGLDQDRAGVGQEDPGLVAGAGQENGYGQPAPHHDPLTGRDAFDLDELGSSSGGTDLDGADGAAEPGDDPTFGA